MSTLSKGWALLAAGTLAAWSQTPHALKVNFEKDSPVTLLAADWGESRTDPRGGAMVLDLHTALTLRNSSPQRIRGVTLLVKTQEFTAGGKGSVTVPSLDVRPGETFPIRIDLRLLRPLLGAAGPMAEVTVDGVLFEDLSFYGPNKLNSRRLMTAWELEAQRDRRRLKSILEAKGVEALKQEMLAIMARLDDSRNLDVQVLRRGGGRATAVAAQEREVRFAFVQLPDAPIEPLAGVARVAGSEARSPRIEVLNRSDRPVRYFEIGWVIKDSAGHEYVAGSVPASNSGLALAPGAKGQVAQDAALRFSRDGRPIAIDSMSGYVSQVEFSDGSMWIPGRSVFTASPEEQRLLDLYRKKGPAALANELKRF